jgi:hypothetical protein
MPRHCHIFAKIQQMLLKEVINKMEAGCGSK